MSKPTINISLNSVITTEVIRVPFTKEQLAERKDSLASTLQELSTIEEEFALIKKEFKLKMEPVKEKLTKTLTDIKLGFEDKKMEVQNMANDEEKIIEFWSVETGAKVGFRMMTLEERPAIQFPVEQSQD